MASQTICDRCESIAAVVTMSCGELRRDLCAGCRDGLAKWAETTRAADLTPTGKVRNRYELAVHQIEKHGFCSAGTLAKETGEPQRRVYFGLRELKDRGLLKLLGRGVFVLPATAKGGE